MNSLERTNEEFYESFARVMSPRGENLSDYDMVAPTIPSKDIAHFWWLEYFDSRSSSPCPSLDFTLSPQIILDVYKSFIINAKTKEDVVTISMTFMRDAFPEHLLAKDVNDLKSANSIINKFLVEIDISTNLSEYEIFSIKSFRSAVLTYNGALLNDFSIDSPIVSNVFMQTMAAQ